MNDTTKPCSRRTGRAAAGPPRRPLRGRTAPPGGRRTAACAALALVGLLVGCASLRSPSADVSLVPPPQWSAPADAATTGLHAEAASIAMWWRQFGDETMSGLVEQALEVNTNIDRARANLRAARAQRELAASAWSPTLGARASGQANTAEGTPSARQVSAGFDASWEPDLSGGVRAGVDAAEADVRASAANLGDVQVQVAAETAIAYLELRGTQARLVTGLANLESQEQTLRLTQWRAQAGLVTQLDVEQARTAVEQTRAAVPLLQAAIGRTMNALAVLTGHPPGALNALLVESRPLPTPPAGLALTMPAETLRQRPDVRAAEQRVLAAASRVEQADAQRLPSLSIGGSIGLSALAFSSLGAGAGVGSLAAAVNLPVIDGGRIRAQVRTQEALLDDARAAHRATVLAALQDVENTLLALRGAREQLAGQQAAAASARRAARLAEFRYASGLIDFQAVLQTQRTLLQLEDAATVTATELASQHVRLYKALGGGWPSDADAQAAAPIPLPGDPAGAQTLSR